MKEKYMSPSIFELGSIAKLTAGSISSGSEMSTGTCGSCNYNINWRNTSTSGHA